ncbi:ComEC/Rec2 family competence protein [Frigoriflavimonas asaccharolytica]|uniref:Competence protein ComEC n=1 Tax=Frigoriflavimonas asaccharolytica TaxID=2735899 RepID=A0A8J8GB08_9FLAO|nr:ComEC/Rec2 family competence protein [Frigoriflavimonas asaccharolytica]NRS93920.1 competence protein ComEC [Frigoriflavimonas asaccharolytica]
MQKQPLVILLLSFILGILAQEFFGLSVNKVCIVLVLSALALIIFFTKNIKLLRFKNIFYVIIAFGLGVFMHFFQNQIPRFPKLEKEETLIFKLDKKLKSNDKNRKYEVIAWKSAAQKIADSLSFRSIIIIPKSEEELDFKNFYQATGFVSKIEPPQNDYQFNYQKYLQRKGIFYQTYLPKGFKKSSRKSLNFAEIIKQNRLELLQKIEKSSISYNTKELIKGIILADRTEMNSVTVSDFQKTGLVHILAISGTHIAIIFGLFYFIFIKIFPPRWRRLAIISSILFIWMFAVFIGLGSSVFRACLMLTIYFSYVILQRKTDFLHSISLAAFVILLFNVNQFFDVGFQLSFSAVLGIFWFNQPILQWFPKWQNKVLNLFKNIFSVTTSAQLGTLPLVLFYFHQYSWISILANLIILPAIEILIIGALFITILVAFGLKTFAIFNVYDSVSNFILKIIHWLSSFDFFLVQNIAMNIFEVAILCVFLYYLRFIFTKFNLKTILNLGYIFIFFLAVRVGLYFYFQQKEEIVTHQYYKQKIVSRKKNNSVVFYMKNNADEMNVKNFVVNPYLTSIRTSDFQIKKVPQSVDSIVLGNKKFEVK